MNINKASNTMHEHMQAGKMPNGVNNTGIIMITAIYIHRHYSQSSHMQVLLRNNDIHI